MVLNPINQHNIQANTLQNSPDRLKAEADIAALIKDFDALEKAIEDGNVTEIDQAKKAILADTNALSSILKSSKDFSANEINAINGLIANIQDIVEFYPDSYFIDHKDEALIECGLIQGKATEILASLEHPN